MSRPGRLHPYLDWPGPLPIAHRGGTQVHPENTLPAFEHATSLGYRFLETDVHLSADGMLVAFHDSDLRRTCGIDASIGDLPWREIAELRVDGTAPIPRMRDLFGQFPDTRFNIDAKSDRSVTALTALVAELDVLDRVCLASFSWRRLRRMRRRLGRGLLTNMSPIEIASLRFLSWVPGSKPRAAQVPTHARGVDLVTDRFVAAGERRGIPIHVWTIDDPEQMHRLLDLGVRGIMTDDPAALREVLVERGAWFG